MEVFQDLYVAELQEARSLEGMLLEALPKLAESASEEGLKTAFREHAVETREQLESIEAILKELGADPKAHKEQSMQRLVEEAGKVPGLVKAGPVRDAALIASAQRIEHYEMAVYGTLAAYAKHLGLEAEHQILRAILEQEKNADEVLSDLAEGIVNPAAVEATR